jgi:tetratricopeptide (TPR) repeat protein
LWAERYDRRLEDIFAVQDEIAGKILLALGVELINGEHALFYQSHSDNLQANLKMFQARSYFYRWNKEGNVLARKTFEEIISMEPEWERPHSLLGVTHLMDVWYRWSDSPVLSIQKAFELAQKALALDESSALAHGIMAFVYSMMRQYEKAIEEGEKAIQLDPNSADAHGLCATALHFAGEPAKAISFLQKAIRLNPFPPGWYLWCLGHAQRNLGNFEESVSAFKKAIDKDPANILAHTGLTATYSLLGLEEEASSEAAEVLKIDPDFSVKNLANTLPYKNKLQLETYIDALLKAGLPE